MTLGEIQSLTLADLEVLNRSSILQEADFRRKASLEAYLNRQVRATDKKGRYIFQSFEDFFNYEETLAQLEKGTPEETKKDEKDQATLYRMADLAKAYNLRMQTEKKKARKEG